MKKNAEPSRTSLKAIPELDFTRFRRQRRGKYAARARRSFAVALIEPELFARFGSSEAVSAALRAVVLATDSVRGMRPRRKESQRKGARRSAA